MLHLPCPSDNADPGWPVIGNGTNRGSCDQEKGRYLVKMTEGFGRRLARYRKRMGFDSAEALAAATGGRVSQAVLQNIESGRKADPTVAQLLEISRALGVSPLLLLAPLETPLAPLDLAGVGEQLAGMTAIDFDEWVRGVTPVAVGRAPALQLRWQVEQIRQLVTELRDWQTADQARRHNELLDATTHQRNPFTDLDELAQQQREARIDLLHANLTGTTELTWARRPWTV